MLATYADLLSLRSDLIQARVRLEFARTDAVASRRSSDLAAAERAIHEALAKVGASISAWEDADPAPAPSRSQRWATSSS